MERRTRPIGCVKPAGELSCKNIKYFSITWLSRVSNWREASVYKDYWKIVNVKHRGWFVTHVQVLYFNVNRLRTITSDRIVYNCFVAFFSFWTRVGTISLDRNYWEVINLLFPLPGLYLNILRTEKTLQFSGQTILGVRGASFQRKRLTTESKKMFSAFLFSSFLILNQRRRRSNSSFIYSRVVNKCIMRFNNDYLF